MSRGDTEITLDAHTVVRLRKAAAARAMTVRDLARRLVEVAAEEGVCTAILDDAVDEDAWSGEQWRETLDMK